MKNIFQINDQLISKSEINTKRGHKSPTFWLTGLSGSGKSTLAIACEKILFEKGFFCKVLDGDNIRGGLSNNLGFSAEDRQENIRRIAEVNKLFNKNGVITISSFISPLTAFRRMAKEIIGVDFYEIYIKSSVESCEKRDVKGLYKKARLGEIPNFTGISAPYEVPQNPDLVVDTDALSLDESLEKIMTFIQEKINLSE